MVVLPSRRKGDCSPLFIRKIEISGGGGLGREEEGRGGRRGREKTGDNVDEAEVWFSGPVSIIHLYLPS